MIKLEEFQSDLVHTLLLFIYTARTSRLFPLVPLDKPKCPANSAPELELPDIKDHRVTAKLYNMSNHFKLPKLGEAVVAAIRRHAVSIVSTRRGAGGALVSFTKKQLDELVEAVRLAYNGDRV